MGTDKKYLMLVFEEKETCQKSPLEFFSNHPEAGTLSDLVYGDNAEELMQSSDGNSNEGLFYILYSLLDGKRIGYGIIDFDSIKNDIAEYS